MSKVVLKEEIGIEPLWNGVYFVGGFPVVVDDEHVVIRRIMLELVEKVKVLPLYGDWE